MSRKLSSYWYIKVAVATLLLCLLAPLNINLPVVPITLQSLLIILAAVVIGYGGALAVLLYIVIGLAGAPVFASFNAGTGVLSGASAGFILAFVPVAVFSAWWGKRLQNSYAAIFLLFLGSHILLLILGFSWQLAGGTSLSAVWSSALPLLPGLIIKSLIGTVLGVHLRRLERI